MLLKAQNIGPFVSFHQASSSRNVFNLLWWMKVFKVLYVWWYASAVVEVSNAEASFLNPSFPTCKYFAFFSTTWLQWNSHPLTFCKMSSLYIKESLLNIASAISEQQPLAKYLLVVLLNSLKHSLNSLQNFRNICSFRVCTALWLEIFYSLVMDD